jgi:hypothetical protein
MSKILLEHKGSILAEAHLFLIVKSKLLLTLSENVESVYDTCKEEDGWGYIHYVLVK